jgi:deoxyribonuclease V
MSREELRLHAGKMVDSKTQNGLFSDFNSDEPLRSLAEFQRMTADNVIIEDPYAEIERFAGVDAAYSDNKVYAACVVVDVDMSVTSSGSVVAEAPFPYIPGYLAFREAPACMEAVRKAGGFDMLLVNGHGIAHPRGCGLASLIGVALDVACVGIARRLLVGDVGEEMGGWAPITYGGVNVGAEIREKGRAPVYVSPGHRISLETAVSIVMDLRPRGGLPEPLRFAHGMAEEMRRAAMMAA